MSYLQIAFGPTIDLVVFDKKIESNFRLPTNVQELEHILKEVHSLEMCPGGPSVKYYATATPRHAFRDLNVWRHKKCCLIIQSTQACRFCASLHATLTQNVNRQESRKRKRLPPASPEQELETIKKKRKIDARRLLRTQRAKTKLEYELSAAKKKISKLQKRKLSDFLEKCKLPQNQVIVDFSVLEALSLDIPEK